MWMAESAPAKQYIAFATPRTQAVPWFHPLAPRFDCVTSDPGFVACRIASIHTNQTKKPVKLRNMDVDVIPGIDFENRKRGVTRNN